MGDTEEEALVSKPQEELGLGFECHSLSPPPLLSSDVSNPLSSNVSDPDPDDDDPATVENLDGELQNLGLEEDENKNENPEENKTVVKEEKSVKYHHHHQYPQRPGEPDCAYFLRNGTCRYGLNCRYNHPSTSRKQDRSSSKSPELDEVRSSSKPFESGEFAWEDGEEKENKVNRERSGQFECKYYFRPGGCKYGKACRFQHPQEKTFVGPPLDLNFLGLPIRPGEKECVYYMRNGSCKFASNCRFNHPDPTDPGGLDPRYHNDGSLPLHSSGLSQPTVTSWPLTRSSNEMVPFLDASPSYGSVVPPPQGVHPTLEWNGYLAPINPLYPPSMNMGPMGLVPNGTTNKADGFAPHQQQMPVEEFPERPGQLECQYFMKNGDCKFKSNCKFHHPKDRAPKCVLNSMGLPLRPDQIVCSYYSRYGICKFGPACKYDHPPNCGSSALGGGARNGNESLIPQSV